MPLRTGEATEAVRLRGEFHTAIKRPSSFTHNLLAIKRLSSGPEAPSTILTNHIPRRGTIHESGKRFTVKCFLCRRLSPFGGRWKARSAKGAEESGENLNAKCKLMVQMGMGLLPAFDLSLRPQASVTSPAERGVYARAAGMEEEKPCLVTRHEHLSQRERPPRPVGRGERSKTAHRTDYISHHSLRYLYYQT